MRPIDDLVPGIGEGIGQTRLNANANSLVSICTGPFYELNSSKTGHLFAGARTKNTLAHSAATELERAHTRDANSADEIIFTIANMSTQNKFYLFYELYIHVTWAAVRAVQELALYLKRRKLY